MAGPSNAAASTLHLKVKFIEVLLRSLDVPGISVPYSGCSDIMTNHAGEAEDLHSMVQYRRFLRTDDLAGDGATAGVPGITSGHAHCSHQRRGQWSRMA